MPNATVRANARALSETTTRRAALGAIIAAGAIGVAPIVTGAATAASGPADLDVGLFTLIDEAREAGARVEAAIGTLGQAQERTLVEMMAALEVREDQLIAALDHQNEARRIARDRSGETAAEERLEQLLDEKYDACNRVATTRARTLSGVLAKLALIAQDFDEESTSELPGEMGTSPEILFSVAVDFKELKAGQGSLKGART
jgi:hypothetical protein